MAESPEQRQGVTPGALVLQVPISFRGRHDEAWRAMWPVAQQTLLCGGNVYVLHCRASPRTYRGSPDAQPYFRPTVRGLHQAPDREGVARVWVEEWVRDTRRTAPTQGYIATSRSNMHVDAGGGVPLCRHRQGEQQFQPPQERLLRRDPPRGTGL